MKFLGVLAICLLVSTTAALYCDVIDETTPYTIEVSNTSHTNTTTTFEYKVTLRGPEQGESCSTRADLSHFFLEIPFCVSDVCDLVTFKIEDENRNEIPTDRYKFLCGKAGKDSPEGSRGFKFEGANEYDLQPKTCEVGGVSVYYYTVTFNVGLGESVVTSTHILKLGQGCFLVDLAAPTCPGPQEDNDACNCTTAADCEGVSPGGLSGTNSCFLRPGETTGVCQVGLTGGCADVNVPSGWLGFPDVNNNCQLAPVCPVNPRPGPPPPPPCVCEIKKDYVCGESYTISSKDTSLPECCKDEPVCISFNDSP